MKKQAIIEQNLSLNDWLQELNQESKRVNALSLNDRYKEIEARVQLSLKGHQERPDASLDKPSFQEQRELSAALLGSEAKTGLASYLESHEWDYFFTVTTRKPWQDAIALNKTVYETLTAATSMERAFIATEPHYLRSGVHAHGLAKVDSLYKGIVPVNIVWGHLFQRFGRSSVDVIRSHENVSTYCSKYVTKSEGDYYFWGRKDFWNNEQSP